MRKSLLTGAGFFALGILAATLIRPAITPQDAIGATSSKTYQLLNLFGDVFDRVRTDYVEEPEDNKLIESAINGMLTSLDPHSSYMNPKRFRDMQVHTRGEFGGLGIEVTMEKGVVKVVAPIDETPAARAGIQANDLITHLDGKSIVGLTLSQAVDKMRGRVKTPIKLTVVRKGAEEPLEITIVRDIIRIRSVRSRVEKDIGYIRITTFNEQTHQGLVKAIKTIERKVGSDLKGYILDLRNNPGGLLDQAIAVSDDFLERGEIVSTRGRNKEETQRYNARKGDLTGGKPVVVLINGGSASASEIVAGALQDHKRATVVGSHSFGKGSVQTIIPLGGRNGAVRLTTARYYTPSGRSIQARGIDPDVDIIQESPDAKKKKVKRAEGESSLRGHLKSEKSKERSGSSSYVPTDKTKDIQLTYALKLLRGEKVSSTGKQVTTK